MEIRKSDIVCSLAGRDKGRLYYVVDLVDGRAVLTDGKGRRLDKLKSKNPKHLRIVAVADNSVSKKILLGQEITNGEVRRSLLTHSTDSAVE